MGLVLKIMGVVFVGLLLLGVCVNNVLYPLNIIASVGIVAGGVHIVKTLLKNKNV